MNEHQITVTIMSIPITVTYLNVGEGLPVLLLHGIGDSSRSWEKLIFDFFTEPYTAFLKKNNRRSVVCHPPFWGIRLS